MSPSPPPHPSQYFYLPAATVLKRWAGETASAVFVHVDESLQGMDVIRAFGAVDYFIQVGGGGTRRRRVPRPVAPPAQEARALIAALLPRPRRRTSRASTATTSRCSTPSKPTFG